MFFSGTNSDQNQSNSYETNKFVASEQATSSILNAPLFALEMLIYRTLFWKSRTPRVLFLDLCRNGCILKCDDFFKRSIQRSPTAGVRSCQKFLPTLFPALESVKVGRFWVQEARKIYFWVHGRSDPMRRFSRRVLIVGEHLWMAKYWPFQPWRCGSRCEPNCLPCWCFLSPVGPSKPLQIGR